MLDQQLNEECQAMARYALASGLQVAPATSVVLQRCEAGEIAVDDIQSLTSIHGQLSKLIAPATPRAILLLSKEGERKGFASFLGGVPFTRGMMLVAGFFLISFVLISMSEDINADQTTGDMLRSSGIALLLNQLFYISAAGLGASFAALFQANQFVTKGTYDPKYESSYWVRLALGLMAGLILSQLIPLETEETLSNLGRPALAMLGGFSASAVYKILKRIMDSLEALVQGNARDMVEAQAEVNKARIQEQTVQMRIETATRLMKLKDKLTGGDNDDALKHDITDMINEIMQIYDAGGVSDPPGRPSKPGGTT